jgi:hypothetical protein
VFGEGRVWFVQVFQTFQYKQYDKSTTRNISDSFEGGTLKTGDTVPFSSDGEIVQGRQSATRRDSRNTESDSGDKTGDTEDILIIAHRK